MVVPPESTSLAYKSLRMSTSHFVMSWKEVSLASSPMKLGWNNTSAQQKRSSPTVMMFPSGRSSLAFIVEGANVVNSFVMCSTISRDMVVPLDNTTPYKFLRMSVTLSCVVVQSNVAEILFHIPNDLPLCGGSDRVSRAR